MKFSFFFVFKPWKCGPTPFLLFWLIRKIYIFIEALGNCESLTFFRLTSAHLSYLSDIFGKRKVTRRQFEKQEASPEMPSSILKWDLCRKKKKHRHLLIFWKTASNVKEFSESYCNLVWSHFGFICNIILPTMISFSSIAYMHKKNMNSQKKTNKSSLHSAIR